MPGHGKRGGAGLCHRWPADSRRGHAVTGVRGGRGGRLLAGEQPTGRMALGWPEWAAVVFFALFALRAFCWLIFTSGGSVLVLSPNNLGDLPLHLTYIRYFAKGPVFWPENPIYSGLRAALPRGHGSLQLALEPGGLRRYAGAHLGGAGRPPPLRLTRSCAGEGGLRWWAFSAMAAWRGGNTSITSNSAWRTTRKRWPGRASRSPCLSPSGGCSTPSRRACSCSRPGGPGGFGMKARRPSKCRCGWRRHFIPRCLSFTCTRFFFSPRCWAGGGVGQAGEARGAGPAALVPAAGDGVRGAGDRASSSPATARPAWCT